ncbi:hypothetical protein [Erwinia aphidicola]|jgi:hypothetical protein|uniref:hypothetical protein n=1 Tax=Erwinia aphidicola TaxID=68334 RepID=UPI00300CA588
MNIVYYSIAEAVAFVAILVALIVITRKLKTARADSDDKASQLARYAVIVDAEDEAARIVTQAKTEASTTISASETDAKFITDSANAVLKDARTAAEKLSNEILQTVAKQLAKKVEIEEQIQALRASYASKKITYDELESALSIYKEDMDFAEMGFYAPHFDFDTSELFQVSIRGNRQQQKDLLRNKTTSFRRNITSWPKVDILALKQIGNHGIIRLYVTV